MVDEADFSELIPHPKALETGTGTVDLVRPVRLAAAESLKAALQEILARAGVRVNGQAGAFPVDAEVGDMDLDGVPEEVRAECYELELREDRALIRSRGRPGVLWGMQTLAALFRAADRRTIPTLCIRDWPDLANRGIFVEDKWGPDRMTREDWFLVIQRLAAHKMNRLGIGLYGCWGNCRFEPGPEGKGWPTEFLMVPVPGYPELKSEKRLRWYSPLARMWRDETYLPRIFAEDFLGEVVAYGRERGVTVVPFVNSLGHNTMIPRLVPEISAKDERGESLGIGYCLANPQTLRFIEGFYGSVVDRYYPDGADFFHIQLDEVWSDHPDPADPHRSAEPWCRCPECRSREREENLQEYVVWLVEMLAARGVRRVVMWNDQLTRHMDALDGGLVGKLKERGLLDRLILHWWWYSNEALNERTRVAIGKELGLPGWVAPMTCYFNWQRYEPKLDNIELMLNMAHEEGAQGAVSYAVHDPGWTDHEMLLASYAWNFAAVGTWEAQEERWARARFGTGADRYLAGTENLRTAATGAALGKCHHYTYTYCREGDDWPRPYPGEALAALEEMGGAAEQLREAAALAQAAAETFSELAADLEGDDREILTSLLGEAARIVALGRAFAVLLEIREEGAPDAAVPGGSITCLDATDELTRCMRVIEENKPHWVVPATLQSLSVLLVFMEQLAEALNQVTAGEKTWGEVCWHVEQGSTE